MKKQNKLLLCTSILLMTLMFAPGFIILPPASLFSGSVVTTPVRLVLASEHNSLTPEEVTVVDSGSSSAGSANPDTPAADKDVLAVQMIIRLLIFDGYGIVRGMVWNDVNGNNRIDSGENGVQGIRVYVDTDGNASYSPPDIADLTAADGTFTLERLRGKNHTLFIDQATVPQGYRIITDHPVTLTLLRNEQKTQVSFGFREFTAQVSGSIWDQTANQPLAGAFLFLDTNGDQQYTLGEPHGTSSGSGSYQIRNLPADTYTLILDNSSLKESFHRTPVSGTNPAPFILSPGGSQTISFTYAKKSTIYGTLRDVNGNTWANVTLFLDLNGNGIYDAGEPIVTTNSHGFYSFTNLLPGTYTVLLLPDQLGNYSLIGSPGTFTVGGGVNFKADFLTQGQPGGITGEVWSDENGNRSRGTGETGLSAITVFLDSNNNGALDGGEPSTLTDTEGTYAFSGLTPGIYTIRVNDQPLSSAYTLTTTNPLPRTVRPGETVDGANFGYQRKIALVNTLQYPTRLTWDSNDTLYVTDNALGSLFILDTNLTPVSELKNLSRPLGVAVDPAGNIFVGNSGRKNVEVYDQYGNLLRTIGAGGLDTPNDLAFDRSGNLYILDSAKDSVLVYTTTGTPTGTTIGDPARIKYATSIAIGYRPDGSGGEIGEIYVADLPNCTIQVFTLDGNYQRSLGECGSLYVTNWDGKFSGLVSVNIDRYGNVHGLDNNLNVVQVFSPVTGLFLESYNAYPVNNEFFLNLQSDAVIHPGDGRVIITNAANSKVEEIHTVP